MSTRGEQSAFDSALESYKGRLQSIKSSEAVDIARRIAESDDPVEEARQAVEQIVTPIGIDILKDAIMHKLGMKGNLKKALKNSLDKVIEARKKQVEQLKGQLQDAKDRADKLTRQGQNSNRGAQDQEGAPKGDAADDGTGDNAGDGDGATDQPDDPAAGDVADQGNAAADDALSPAAQPPAGQQDLPESIDVDGLQSGQDVRNASSALKQRFNNLTPEAQQRVTQNYADDDGVVRSGEGEGSGGKLSLDDYKINLGTMQENIENEEKAGNIKPQADDAAQGNPADVDANAGPNADVSTAMNDAASTRVPVSARPNAAQDQIGDADPEADGVLGQGANGLEDNSQGIGGVVRNLASRLQARLTQANVPNQAGDGQVPGLRAQATSQGAPNPAGDTQAPPASDTPAAPKPPTAPDEDAGGAGGEDLAGAGAGAEEGASGAAGAAEAAAGATSGIEATEAGLLASAPETGGLGAVLAGVVGIGAALASIFAPHHHKEAPPPPTPNLSTPVLQLGI
ncbi:MAG: hypothetical protein ACTSPB_13845 [Candidatus Thorarchaeota archaeon]